MSKKNKPKKKRWWSYLADAYRVSKKTYPWTAWALLAGFAIGLVLGLLGAIGTKLWWVWIPLAIFMGVVFALLVLTQLVRRASYAQIDGMPGASAAVLGQIKRGWVIEQEPVRFNARTQDMLFRAIGRPGIVLISEGPADRVDRLIQDERKAIKRVAPSVPVDVIKVGNGEGQVPISKLERRLKKLPKRISHQEVAAVTARMKAIQTNALPIPKGIDPFNARPDRRAMRGR
ncbi:MULTISPECIES: DUF4191 domain-containing protein [Trueperella]|uniref:DUF4191 domain-containing protein n=1 Tax=Trueperella abortisuis TaxID=445930 RepID=A0ABT9PHS1_9ACTO|nr:MULTISPECIES: DUF4191 domain-containing protein [Trueperella]MCI7304693.1 DUF4191 domain-containing protein [Trueperella sp.]MDP9832266.1 hypothetical protein [Trueperella abortisuis]MDY5403752.1 DUF4191 domain-containing protein [Trueperella sp.]